MHCAYPCTLLRWFAVGIISTLRWSRVGSFCWLGLNQPWRGYIEPSLDPKLAQFDPKLTQAGPSWPTVGPELAPSWFKLAPSWRRLDPSCHQIGTKVAASSSQLSLRLHEGRYFKNIEKKQCKTMIFHVVMPISGRNFRANLCATAASAGLFHSSLVARQPADVARTLE